MKWLKNQLLFLLKHCAPIAVILFLANCSNKKTKNYNENKFDKTTENKEINIKISLKEGNSYKHLKGKIGNAFASIELNFLNQNIKAYLYADSLEGINGLICTTKEDSLIMEKDEFLFVGGIKKIEKLLLKKNNDTTYSGCVISNNKVENCYFNVANDINENKFSNLYSHLEREINNFPISLTSSLLFINDSFKHSKEINNYLIKSYDEIGNNYETEVKRMNFSNIENWKNKNDYNKYLQEKFIQVSNKIIDANFIKNAKESGHSDIFLNELNAEILVNDGAFLVIKLTTTYADGDSYPYYDTKIITYDYSKNICEEKNEYTFATITKIEKIKNKQIEKQLMDTSQNSISDNLFFERKTLAFNTKNGFVLVFFGGNHGIQPFLKYYSN